MTSRGLAPGARHGRHAAVRVAGVTLDGACASGMLPGRGPAGAPYGGTAARGKGRLAMLGCVTVFGLLLGGICGCGLGSACCCTG